MENNDSSKNNLAVPFSIVIAGALIALAIFASNKSPDTKAIGGVKAGAVTIESAAKSVGINAKSLATCLESDKYVSKVTSEVDEAQSTGGNGTPWSIVIGPTGKKYPLSGAQPIEKVKAVIDLALNDGSPDAAVTDAVSRPGMSAADIAVAKQNLEKKLPNIKPVTETDHYLGDIKAPVKIVQFTDIDCPFCKRFHTTMQEVMKTYGKDNKVAWVMRHFPLTQLHPDAANKAEAAECVRELGGNDKFWEFVDKLSK